MWKLTLKYSGYLMRIAHSLEKILMLGRSEGRRRRGNQRMRQLDSITNAVNELGQTPGDGAGQGGLACCSPQGHKELDIIRWLNNNNHCIYYGGQESLRRNGVAITVNKSPKYLDAISKTTE